MVEVSRQEQTGTSSALSTPQEITGSVDNLVNRPLGGAIPNKGRFRLLKEAGYLLRDGISFLAHSRIAAEMTTGIIGGFAVKTAIKTGLIATGIGGPMLPIAVGALGGMTTAIYGEYRRQQKETAEELPEERFRFYVNAACRGIAIGGLSAFGGIMLVEAGAAALESLQNHGQLSLPSLRGVFDRSIQDFLPQSASADTLAPDHLNQFIPDSTPNPTSTPEPTLTFTAEPSPTAESTPVALDQPRYLAYIDPLSDTSQAINGTETISDTAISPAGTSISGTEALLLANDPPTAAQTAMETKISSISTLSIPSGSYTWEQTSNLLHQLSPNQTFTSTDVQDLTEVLLKENKLFEPDWVSTEERKNLLAQGYTSARNILGGTNLILTDTVKKTAVAIALRS